MMGLVCLWLAVGWVTGEEKRGAVSEYEVKAAFLYNFTKFADWPSNASASPYAPLVIGIVGEDPFGNVLDKLVSGESVRGRLLVVKRLRAEEDLRSCQVLFISRSEKDRLPVLLGQLKGSPVLTVGDFDGFARQGGMVNLLLVQKTMKLEINQTAAEQAGLQISAKLLKLARIVRS